MGNKPPGAIEAEENREKAIRAICKTHCAIEKDEKKREKESTQMIDKKQIKLKVVGDKYALVGKLDKGTEGTTFKCFHIKNKNEVFCAKLFDQRKIQRNQQA